jgi:hypothetical protein
VCSEAFWSLHMVILQQVWAANGLSTEPNFCFFFLLFFWDLRAAITTEGKLRKKLLLGKGLGSLTIPSAWMILSAIHIYMGRNPFSVDSSLMLVLLLSYFRF